MILCIVTSLIFMNALHVMKTTVALQHILEFSCYETRSSLEHLPAESLLPHERLPTVYIHSQVAHAHPCLHFKL
jgi:hypothetical protein